MTTQRAMARAGLAVLLGLSGCAESDPTADNDEKQELTPKFEPPADWTRFATKCSLSFRAPPGTSEKIVQGTDSCVTQYTASDCDLSGDYGSYSDPLTGNAERPEYTNEPTRIDGRDATLVRFRTEPESGGDSEFAAGVHFAHVTGDFRSPVRFTFYASCKSAAGQAAMLDLFKTIDFAENTGQKPW